MFGKVVQVVLAAALLLGAIAIVMLFTNSPTSAPVADTDIDVPVEIDSAAIYSARCAACHGGDGSGGIGPPLSSGRVVDKYPVAADQARVVADGRGAMPSFASKLSGAEIDAVVEYTRTSLP